ncbi:MAG: amidohydrolase family protein [Candidatus Cloacimonetes bacterium]|nr:amidohydrolase family protein [Candidatus Cloacimonadota bacterium]
MLLQLCDLILVWPDDAGLRVRRGDIFIAEGIVRFDIPSRKPDRVIDCGGAVAMPGLVNAHHHIYSTLATGLDPGRPLHDFTGILRGLWWRLDRALNEEAVKLSALLAARDSLRHGVTTVFDHHVSVPFIEDSLHIIDDILRGQGVGAVLCWEGSGRHGDAVYDRITRENLSFAADAGRGMLGLHASFTLSDRQLRRTANSGVGMPIHIHVAEGIADVEDTVKNYGCTIIERLEAHDLLRPGSLLAHGCRLNNTELAMLSGRDVWLALAVESNLNNALPPLDAASALAAGVRLCTGTDGMGGDVLRSWRAMFLQHRLLHSDPDSGFDVAAAMLLGGYSLKEFWGFPLGVRDGERADIAVFDYVPAGPVTSLNALGHLLYGLAGSAARWVVQADRITLDEGCPTAPLPDIYHRREVITRRLWKRFAKQE